MVNSVRAETYPRKPAIRNGFRAFLRLLAMFLLLAVAGGTGASGGTPTPLQQLILDYLSAHSLPLTPKGIAAGAKLAGVSVFDIGEAFGLTPNQSSAWLSNPANATCPGDCVCTAPGPCAAKTWTVMIYMAGDNNLSDTALLNLNQMKSANSSANVRVVVLVEFSPTYTPGVSSNTLYGTVTNGSADLQSVGQNIDMGNRQSLRDFVRWAKGTYPADHYALVLWSHGGGWKDRSLVRGAIAVLLQQPSLALTLGGKHHFQGLRLPGVELLLELLGLVEQRPDISTGALLEHFDGREEQASLHTLAAQTLPGTEASWTQELHDAVAQLEKQLLVQRLEELLAKQRQQGLDDTDKYELRELLKARAGLRL